jgi:hypothetical protein
MLYRCKPISNILRRPPCDKERFLNISTHQPGGEILADIVEELLGNHLLYLSNFYRWG